MTIKDLEEMLIDLPKDMLVFIPVIGEAEIVFVSPCLAESGLLEEEGEEDMFLLAPHGFFGEEHDEIDPILN